MKRGQAFPGKFLSAASLTDGPIAVTIDTVKWESVSNDSKEQKPTMFFKEDVQPMVLNATNWDTVERAYGDESDDWTGKTVEIHVGNTQFQGKTVPCLRIHIPAVAQPAATQAPAFAMMPLPWKDAQTLASMSGIGLPELTAALKAKGCNAYLPSRDGRLVHEIIAEHKAAPVQHTAFDQPEESIPF